MKKWIVFFVVVLFAIGDDVRAETQALPTSRPLTQSSAPSSTTVMPAADASHSGPNESYLVPNWVDLVHTLVRLHAISLDDETLLDEYSIITQCDLYKYYYQDEFKWNKVRAAILANTLEKQATYPLAYSFDTKLQLNHYDFHQNLYVFSDKATLSHVNSIVMYEVTGPACGSANILYMPRQYQVVFDAPVTVLGLPLSQASAEALQEIMKLEQNTDKIIYTRFNFHLLYADPYRRLPSKKEIQYAQGGDLQRTHVRIDAHLESVRFYDDEAETHLIYEFKP